MDQYEAMMDSQLPATNQPAMSNYQGPLSFPQFSDNNDSMNSSYGNLPGMAGSYPTTPTTPAGNMSLGAYNAQGTQASPYSTSSSTFSMPYDPPPLQGTPSLPIPTPPPPQQSMKPIYSCTYCGLVLSSNNALIEHKRIHTGERPYACQVCNKRFTQKAHLNIHKRIHTGEKPYACHICHKRFAQSSHLSSHKRIHTGEKPFVCGICHVGFTQKQRLDVHLKKHMERPGQDISSGARRPIMLAQARMADRMEAFRQGLPRDDSVNMMHMVGQGMPYIKQETGGGDVHGGNTLPQTMEYKPMPDRGECVDDMRQSIPRDYNKSLDGQKKLGEKSRDEMEGEVNDNNQNKPDPKNQNISAPSFSSEGMFLHPSGYVAYGGIEENEDSQHSPRIGPSHPAGSASQQSMSPSSGHRRKATIVRKRQSESPDKGPMEGAESIVKSEVINGLHRFNALNPQDQNVTADGRGVGEEDDEDDDDTVENGEGEEFKDTGEVLDDKSDPPYPENAHAARNIHYDHQVARKSVPGGTFGSVVETRSHARRISMSHEEMVNGERIAMNHGHTISYAGPVNSMSNTGLVKVNNRISLVNFTADELITHLMKRDDVHCCQFCCLIFQDAAMYHIHRNMHDKQDIRKCNMCGKMLLDKYDFTAHFLSMHQH